MQNEQLELAKAINNLAKYSKPISRYFLSIK